MERTIVKKWKPEYGYGFVGGPDSVDIFVHYSVVDPGMKGRKDLVEGAEVDYEYTTTDKGLQATIVRTIA